MKTNLIRAAAAFAALAAFAATSLPANARIATNGSELNALLPNAVDPNAIEPNAIATSALTGSSPEGATQLRGLEAVEVDLPRGQR